MKTKFSIGNHVYYKDNGQDDSGTIVEVGIYSSPAGREEIVYGIEWDNEQESGLIPDNGGFTAGQLAHSYRSVNPLPLMLMI